MATSQKTQQTPKPPTAAEAPAAAQATTPEEIQTLFRSTTVDLSKTGSNFWTGDKNDSLARTMIKNTNPDANAEFSDELGDIVTLIFDPNREVKMRVLKRYAENEGFNLDATTEGLLDLQFDQGAFATALSKMKDPETAQPLVTRKTKKNRSATMKTLFGD